MRRRVRGRESNVFQRGNGFRRARGPLWWNGGRAQQLSSPCQGVPSMGHTPPTKVLLATTLQPFVGQLSGSLAHGAKLIDQCLPQEPTPQHLATFERELHRLLRAGGRRMMA